MKYEKERKFVKEACNQLKEEVIVSRIKLLESGSDRNGLNYVMYEDRFGREFQITKRNGIYSKKEYVSRETRKE